MNCRLLALGPVFAGVGQVRRALGPFFGVLFLGLDVFAADFDVFLGRAPLELRWTVTIFQAANAPLSRLGRSVFVLCHLLLPTPRP